MTNTATMNSLQIKKHKNDALLGILIVIFSIWIIPFVDLFGLSIPMPFAHLLALILLIKNRLFTTVIDTFKFIILCFVVSLMSPEPFEYFQERFKVIAQFASSIFIMLVLFESFVKEKNILFESYLIKLCVLITLVACFEATGLLREPLDLLRLWLYEDRTYISFDRDIDVYGILRPMVLNKEPAHLAFLLCTLWLVYFELKRPSIYFKVFVGLLVIFITRSPASIILIMSIGVFSLWRYSDSLFRALLAMIGVFILGLFFLEIINYFFSSRIQNVLSGDDFSASARLMAPPIIAYEVLLDYPLFGLGFTPNDLILPYNENVFIDLGFLFRLHEFTDDNLAEFITNYFFQGVIALGILGFVIFCFMLRTFFGHLLAQRSVLLVFVIFWMFSLGMGGLVTAKVWVTFFIISLVVKSFQGDK